VSTILGYLLVYVANPLRALENIPQTIQCLIFTACGPDFSLAAPTAPLIPTAQGLPFTTDLEDFSQSMFDTSRMMLDVPQSNYDSEALCIGESVPSLRTLIKRFAYVGSYTLDSDEDLLIHPNYFGDYGSGAPLFYFSNMYRFWRGSVRYKFVLRGRPGDNFITRLRGSLHPISGGPPVAPSVVPTLGDSVEPTHITFSLTNPTLEITVPYYSSSTYSHVSNFSSTRSALANRFVLRVNAALGETLNSGFTIAVYVAAGDDFSFHVPIGPYL
jgi:hypothetical protein